MAPMNRRLRLLSWMVRRQASVASLSEAQVIAMQSRHVPDNVVVNWILGKVAPETEVSDRNIPGPAGQIPVRVYRPSRASSSARPLILNIHGGGFVSGELRMSDWLCSHVATRVDAIVVSVDYRLAPGHRFPAAVDDCYAALRWAAENAVALGAGGPIGVMGDSAGGNLSAVTCLVARDRGGPVISHQALIYPATDMTKVSAVDDKSPFLSGADRRAYRKHYLGDADPADPWLSPLLAADHGRLPSALIQVGEHDPLREDGVRYAAVLRAAGVPVRLTEYAGMPHGFLSFPGLSRLASQALSEICAEQAAVLVQPTTVSGTAS